MKVLLSLLLFSMLIMPISAINNCNCDRAINQHAYCVSIGNKIDCDPGTRLSITSSHISIIEMIPDGSKEHPIHWDVDNPSSFGKGWYYYVSPNRPFFLPYNCPTIVGIN